MMTIGVIIAMDKELTQLLTLLTEPKDEIKHGKVFTLEQ